MKVPCVTIRENTERPETVEVGANVVAGVEPEGILKSALMMMERRREWPNPFGDDHAAERMVNILEGSCHEISAIYQIAARYALTVLVL